ncbi:MAG: hypothetical protein KatS3mg031_2975 [Chitinophagales bacterium]|nr:MAG: hypothetical protein KatS3mg031_2975 [Chitinophagales bacterium]
MNRDNNTTNITARLEPTRRGRPPKNHPAKMRFPVHASAIPNHQAWLNYWRKRGYNLEEVDGMITLRPTQKSILPLQ